jgi:hypothetical protein
VYGKAEKDKAKKIEIIFVELKKRFYICTRFEGEWMKREAKNREQVH